MRWKDVISVTSRDMRRVSERDSDTGRNVGRMFMLMLYWKSIIKLACASGVLSWSPLAMLAFKAGLTFHIEATAL
jgi:hypothetical protein